MTAREAGLIRDMALALASLHRRRMYGRRHLDAGLCGYVPMLFEGRPTGVLRDHECSPRCAHVADLLRRAADVLGVDAELLYEASAKPPKARQAAEQKVLL